MSLGNRTNRFGTAYIDYSAILGRVSLSYTNGMRTLRSFRSEAFGVTRTTKLQSPPL